MKNVLYVRLGEKTSYKEMKRNDFKDSVLAFLYLNLNESIFFPFVTKRFQEIYCERELIDCDYGRMIVEDVFKRCLVPEPGEKAVFEYI